MVVLAHVGSSFDCCPKYPAPVQAGASVGQKHGVWATAFAGVTVSLRGDDCACFVKRQIRPKTPPRCKPGPLPSTLSASWPLLALE